MTMTEIAIKAMQEPGFEQARIDQILAFMNEGDEKGLKNTEIPVPTEYEALAMEKAKKYFAEHNHLPSDN